MGIGPPGALSLESECVDLDPSQATLWPPVCAMPGATWEIYDEGMNELCVALGKSLNLSVPQFLMHKVGITMLTS